MWPDWAEGDYDFELETLAESEGERVDLNDLSLDLDDPDVQRAMGWIY